MKRPPTAKKYRPVLDALYAQIAQEEASKAKL